MNRAINAATITKNTVNKRSAESNCQMKKLFNETRTAMISEAQRQFRP
jgi:hypothetical protein